MLLANPMYPHIFTTTSLTLKYCTPTYGSVHMILYRTPTHFYCYPTPSGRVEKSP